MEAYSIHGNLYYQGYSGQAPPPGTAPVQAPPPGTAPAHPPAPASVPLAPPGVAPSPSPTPAAYYGTYTTPSYGYTPPSADRWNSYPVPAAEPQSYPSEPQSYPSYPPVTLPYDRPAYSHHPYYQEPSFPYAPSHPGPPQAYMPLPPRGSDVTNFRKRRPFPPNQNLRTKSKPFKQPQQNFRGGGKNSQQAKRAFNADPRSLSVPFNGNNHPMANNAQILHPFWHNRVDEAPANRSGKKRRMDDRGEGRSGRNDDRRRGDKRARPGWNKGKRNKGRHSGGERSYRDPHGEAVGNSYVEKGENRKVEGSSLTEEQVQEAATWLDLHRDVRKRVQEFLHTASERGSSKRTGMEDTQEAIGGGANVENQDKQEAIQEAVAGDANGDMIQNDVAAQPDGVDVLQVDHIDASDVDHINALHFDGIKEQPSDRTYAMQSYGEDMLVSVDAVKFLSESLHSHGVNMKHLDLVDAQKFDCGDAPQLVTEIMQNSETGGVQEVAGYKRLRNNQKPLAELVEIAQNLEKRHGKHDEIARQEELKDREERSFEFFTKLLDDNKDLRNMYIEKCSSGTFECLMCHSKMKKRFSNLASLVTHACNVLKTKKLPEHRGYGRAVCSLFGWDPYRIPKVPKVIVSHSGVESAPADDESAPVGGTDVNDAVKHDAVGDAVEEAPLGDANEGAPVDDADVSKLRCDADESEPKDDADGCAPVRDVDGSVEQDVIKDAEEPADTEDATMKELSKDGNGQVLLAEDVEGVNTYTEGGNELMEQAEATDTAKSLQAGSEVTQDLVA